MSSLVLDNEDEPEISPACITLVPSANGHEFVATCVGAEHKTVHELNRNFELASVETTGRSFDFVKVSIPEYLTAREPNVAKIVARAARRELDFAAAYAEAPAWLVIALSRLLSEGKESGLLEAIRENMRGAGFLPDACASTHHFYAHLRAFLERIAEAGELRLETTKEVTP